MINRKITVRSPIYMFVKKHNCPYCTAVLTTKKVSRVLNSKSPGAENFNFSMGETRFIGDVEFSWYVFYCAFCGAEISIEKLRAYECKVKGKDIEKRRNIDRVVCIILFIIAAALYFYFSRAR